MKQFTKGENNFCVQDYGICKFHIVSHKSEIKESTANEKEVLKSMLDNRKLIIKEMNKHINEIENAISNLNQGELF